MPVTMTKADVKRLQVDERKNAREKQKLSLFMRRTRSIYNGQKKRAAELDMEFNLLIDDLRWHVEQALMMSCCLYCGCKLTLRNFVVDHRMPIARGGCFNEGNLDITCAPCNWQKGKMHNGEFHALLAYLRTLEPDVAADIKRRLSTGGKWLAKRF